MRRKAWWGVFGATIGLALVSLASNVTTMSQLEGDANTVLAVRKTFSTLVNSNTVWGGLAILAGWLVRRPLQAVGAGLVSLLTALSVHYGVGLAVGMFDAHVWADNWLVFRSAVVVGGPLGLLGVVARRSDWWGVGARMVVPAAAVLEPFHLGMFTLPAIMPWPDRVSAVASGLILIAAGVSGGVAVLHAARGRRSVRRSHTTATA